MILHPQLPILFCLHNTERQSAKKQHASIPQLMKNCTHQKSILTQNVNNNPFYFLVSVHQTEREKNSVVSPLIELVKCGHVFSYRASCLDNLRQKRWTCIPRRALTKTSTGLGLGRQMGAYGVRQGVNSSDQRHYAVLKQQNSNITAGFYNNAISLLLFSTCSYLYTCSIMAYSIQHTRKSPTRLWQMAFYRSINS